MLVVLGLIAFLLLLDISALSGWAPSTRDGRDWSRADAQASSFAGPSQRRTS